MLLGIRLDHKFLYLHDLISSVFDRLLRSLVAMESYCNIYNTFFAISDYWYFGDALFEKFRDVKNIEFEREPYSGTPSRYLSAQS